MRRSVIAGVLLILLCAGAWWLLRNVDAQAMVQAATDRPVVAATLYVGVLAMSIVALPITSLPLLPLGARLFGIPLGGFLSALGWWLGALIAFAIARWVGRPILRHVVSLAAVDRWEERLSSDITFFGIVLLRMVTPVDVVSFALGLLKRLPFSTYALASLIGILPFAFVWTAVGSAISAGSWLFAAAIGIAMAAAVIILRKYLGIGRR